MELPAGRIGNLDSDGAAIIPDIQYVRTILTGFVLDWWNDLDVALNERFGTGRARDTSEAGYG